jgi:hypothetical protein
MDALGYDRVERMQDMKDWLQANHIPCYQEGEVTKVVQERFRRQSLVVGGSVIQLFNFIFDR